MSVHYCLLFLILFCIPTNLRGYKNRLILLHSHDYWMSGSCLRELYERHLWKQKLLLNYVSKPTIICSDIKAGSQSAKAIEETDMGPVQRSQLFIAATECRLPPSFKIFLFGFFFCFAICHFNWHHLLPELSSSQIFFSFCHCISLSFL